MLGLVRSLVFFFSLKCFLYRLYLQPFEVSRGVAKKKRFGFSSGMGFILHRQSGRINPYTFELKMSDMKVSLLNYVKSLLIHASWEYLLHVL